MDAEEQCMKILDELISSVQPDQHGLLYGKILEMKARLRFNQKNWDEALEILERAQANSDKNHFRYSYYIEQMQASINLFMQPSLKNIGEMKRLQKKAEQLRLWEMARDCDLTLAIATDNIDLYRRLYFGTPHLAYRERLVKLTRLDVSNWPKNFDYILGEGTSQGVLDIENAMDLNSKAKLKSGGVVHRLLKILASDFYLSMRAESLFSLLFPEEYFDPRRFHNRVHNVLARLRRWFRENNIPLDIQENYEEYRLVALAPYTLRLSASPAFQDSNDYLINQIRSEFSKKEFSSTDITKVISISSATSKRVLAEAVERKLISRRGKGRATRYRFSA